MGSTPVLHPQLVSFLRSIDRYLSVHIYISELSQANYKTIQEKYREGTYTNVRITEKQFKGV